MIKYHIFNRQCSRICYYFSDIAEQILSCTAITLIVTEVCDVDFGGNNITGSV